MRKTGRYVTSNTTGEAVRAFVPSPLPPRPAFQMNEKIEALLAGATTAIEKLNIASRLVPNQEWLLYSFVRKEAVITSQIEGTQSTLIDLFTKNEDQPDNEDLEEVCNYIKALQFAWDQLTRKNGLPLSLRLIKESHKILMTGVRGKHKQPGEFRATQNWIGGNRPSKAKFVPPPPREMSDCLAQLENYMHSKSKLDSLIDIGLIHVQFETIHPFLDGNGRIGRLLIALLLYSYGILDTPLLYLSLYFKRRRQKYYSLLNKVRTEGVWEDWIEYFLKGIKEIADDVVDASGKLQRIFIEDRKTLLNNKRATIASIKLHEELPLKPVITMPEVCKRLGLSKPTAVKAINIMLTTGILEEITGKKRDRIYRYSRYLAVLTEGTDL